MKKQARVEEIVTPATIKEVLVQSLIESRLEYKGLETGRLYVWSKAGDTVSIDERDVATLLAKRLGRKQCCGNGDGNKIFQVVGGNYA